ncbi:MAG: hypothetical protein ACSHYC_10200 [Alphaproteobacteria bacterium]
MNYETNPFPTTDADRHAIWEMLVHRDIDAFLGQDWSMVKDDFVTDRFLGMHAHGRSNPDSWRLGFPNLTIYRDEWLRQAAHSAAVEYAEPLRSALFRITTLRDIDMGDSVAVVHKKFDGDIAKADGSMENLNWQTLYFCAKVDGVWKISGFVGYLPFSLGSKT